MTPEQQHRIYRQAHRVATWETRFWGCMLAVIAVPVVLFAAFAVYLWLT